MATEEIRCLYLIPGSGMGKKLGPGSGIRIRDEQQGSYFRESLDTIVFGLKYLNSLMRIRDGKNSDPGQTSRIRNTGYKNLVINGHEGDPVPL